MSIRYWSLPGVRLEPRLCARQLYLASSLVLLASSSLWLSSWHWLVCLLVNIAVAGIAGRQLWRHNRYCCDMRVDALEFDGRHWQMRLQDGRCLQLQLESAPLLHSEAVAVGFRLADHQRASYRVSLLADSQYAEDWRRFQLALRYGDGGGSRMVSRASGASSG